VAAVGGPTSWAFTVRWDGVTFVDESAFLMAEDGKAIVITSGGTDDGEPQIGVLSATFDNARPGSLGRFTPDNPLSPLFPNVKDGAWTRLSVTRGASTSFRHRGRIATGVPKLPSGDLSSSEVAVTAVDMLGTIAARDLDCDFIERWRNEAETQTVDVYPLDEDVDAVTTLRNSGNGGGTARVVPSVARVGSAQTGSAEGIDLDGAITLKASTSGLGPVIIGDTGIAAGSVNTIVVTFRTTDRTLPAGPDKYIALGLDAKGVQVWSLRLKDNAGQCDLNLYDELGAFVQTLFFGFSAIGDDASPDEWFTMLLNHSGGNQAVYLARNIDDTLLFSSIVGAIDARLTDSIVLGGVLGAKKGPGRQTNCVNASFGAFVMSTGLSSFTNLLEPNAVTTAQTRFTDLNLYCDFGSTQSGVRNRAVTRKSTSGRSGFDVAAELVRTTGAKVVAFRTADGSLKWLDADLQRQPTVALTVDLNLDAGDGDLPWRKGDGFTRCRATWPGGSVDYIDTTRPRSDTTRDTCAADEAGARDVASMVVNSARSLRLEQVEIDLASADNDLWVAMMALEVGARIRCVIGAAGSLAVQHYGRTYLDSYVTGWREVYARDSATWLLDLIPADDPVVGKWSTGLRAKYQATPGSMTVTGGSCVGNTGTGTLIVTTSGASPRLSTTATGLVLDWNGEYVACSAAAGAVSPQTVTVTARGVAPTVARVHVAGEPVKVALAAAWAI
jgi:hypothetical protein